LTTNPFAVSSSSQLASQRSAAALLSSARAAAPASRIRGSNARIEVEPPVSISADRVAY
jgi:hypothetical protein